MKVKSLGVVFLVLMLAGVWLTYGVFTKKFTDYDEVVVHAPAELRSFGRIRTVVDGPGSSFYVTTDNGGGSDAILLVRPR